ncbi:uncharacterized protein B0I36DRAFT_377295 [Microdochium trichocladiopsis]|uniref:Rhodopsin domain-containing protein n=1 Tax=Microdochium trichocladiopsis TaxID=1682393 RepID=A0A9P9BKN9_9PEZI|nr:uncharacterized protein B0I36DRAFT_377295 [Microdochium trichocladiopsis]KAH7021449.1 hypothetical protein B0I36DRAFT_377295 [Microdochium trichocladiopsis]
MSWTYNTPEGTPNDGPKLTAIATVFTVLSFLILVLRFYVRGVMIKAIGTDDYVLVITWIAACGFAVITILQSKWGLGLKFVEDMPLENIYNFGLLQYMGAPFYITSILGFKLSLLLSYLRFMTAGAVRTATIVVAVLCCLFHLSFLLVQLNLCQPVAKQWDPAIMDGQCIVAVPFYTSMASLTIVFDVAVMLLPFPVLLKSQIQARKKLVLLGLFALGVFITIIQIIRIQTIRNLANYLDSSGLIMWSTVENNLGIMVASVPTLAPLFKSFAEKSRSGYYKNTSDQAKAGSKYGMHSWRDGDGGSRSGVHNGSQSHSNKVSGGRTKGGLSPEDSQERIWAVGSSTITKKTDIIISRELRGGRGSDST